MKKISSIILLSLVAVSQAFSARNSSSKLVVASYTSFSDSWGKGKDIIKEFESEKGVQVDLLDLGSGFEFIEALKSGRIKADVVIGIDDAHLSVFKGKYDVAKVFDYGYYAFVFDKRSSLNPPKSLNDLVKPEYKGKIILVDPRTSFVGFALLRWAAEVFGERKGFEWFGKAIDNALTVAPSWTVGYSLFTKGEAPLMISYSTSPVYHYENGEDYVDSLLFDEGNLEVREYAMVMSDSSNKELARAFLDAVVRNSKDIAVSNVMYPVSDEGELPEGYGKVRKPDVVIRSELGDDLLLRWQKSII
ncbi:MAG TPA: hypothetical protein DCO86_02810 [Spirochaetaceae bacterium]|nr:hypothetical protein [Spirochaetaceae bacterium]